MVQKNAVPGDRDAIPDRLHLPRFPHRLFTEGVEVHIAARVGVNSGLGDLQKVSLIWVIFDDFGARQKMSRPTGTIFDDDVLIGLDLAEGRAVIGDGFDDVGLDVVER